MSTKKKNYKKKRSKTLCLRHLKKLVKKTEIFKKEDQEKEIQIIPENNQVMSKYGELL